MPPRLQMGVSRPCARTIALAMALVGALSLAPIATASAARAGANPYIVNGSQISISQVPFQVAVLDVRFGGSRSNQFECGGSVLTPTLVITPGHCTYTDPVAGTQETAGDPRALGGTGQPQTRGTPVAGGPRPPPPPPPPPPQR